MTRCFGRGKQPLQKSRREPRDLMLRLVRLGTPLPVQHRKLAVQSENVPAG
eukprot:CAMPEP_0203859468 /NCGR_PEP_ID=MMETSP0359-20131031/11868_1 /ASSEMBLY_ACC=CAM_ASM_000338 /TAXON_ID=268821 /ORGANISM="Scrippsiella Hangoei, Strain SHTV-5" /LENGTH=50 /DNA_ID=CAMNT_0050776391 /DNA_START=174 /DNA_END=323 /DNA_ORIENTATION=+